MISSSQGGTRQRILEAAEASLGEHGYHGTRLRHIAREVGIQKASLFHYFPSKESLYQAVLEQGVEQMEDAITRALKSKGTPLQRIRSLIEAYVDLVAAHPNRTRIFLRQSLGDSPLTISAEAPERLLHTVADFISEAQKQKVFAPGDPLPLVLAIVGTVAFFFTSAPVVAPSWVPEPLSPAGIRRVKRHVLEIAERCLAYSDLPAVSVAVAGRRAATESAG